MTATRILLSACIPFFIRRCGFPPAAPAGRSEAPRRGREGGAVPPAARGDGVRVAPAARGMARAKLAGGARAEAVGPGLRQREARESGRRAQFPRPRAAPGREDVPRRPWSGVAGQGGGAREVAGFVATEPHAETAGAAGSTAPPPCRFALAASTTESMSASMAAGGPAG